VLEILDVQLDAHVLAHGFFLPELLLLLFSDLLLLNFFVFHAAHFLLHVEFLLLDVLESLNILESFLVLLLQLIKLILKLVVFSLLAHFKGLPSVLVLLLVGLQFSHSGSQHLLEILLLLLNLFVSFLVLLLLKVTHLFESLFSALLPFGKLLLGLPLCRSER